MRYQPNMLILIIKNLGISLTSKVMLNKIFHYNHYYFLSLYIRKFNPKVRIRKDLFLEKANLQDWTNVLHRLQCYPKKERKEILSRYNLYHKGFSGCCFFGKNENKDTISIQWLFLPKCNHKIKRKRDGIWPRIKSQEVIIENLYIFPEFRKAGIFSTVNHLILKLAEDDGYTVCNTFIRKDNIESLNGFLALGFKIEKLYTRFNMLGHSWRNAQ